MHFIQPNYTRFLLAMLLDACLALCFNLLVIFALQGLLCKYYMAFFLEPCTLLGRLEIPPSHTILVLELANIHDTKSFLYQMLNF